MALPIFIQVFTVLPSPPEQILKELEKISFSFIWDKKEDKIKRNVIVNRKNEGGLQMPHISSFCAALKVAWLKKVLDINYVASWKTLLLDTLEGFGGDKMLYLPSEGLLKSLHNFNPFWKSVFEVWAKFECFLPQPRMRLCHNVFG